MNQSQQFAQAVVELLATQDTNYLRHPTDPAKIEIYSSAHEKVTLDLTPFQAPLSEANAYAYFDGVSTMEELLAAYRAARRAGHFEEDTAQAMRGVADYAAQYLNALLQQAVQNFTAAQAALVADWVKNLDLYTAVKATESLLNSRADMALLEVAATYGWQIHFDHLAIRCGSSTHQDAERVVALLIQQHGYTPSQVTGEDCYQFPDGWNAYPLYKILRNGQALRLFIDQSAADAPAQIIQHWNRVYGYTAHHLAMRATRLSPDGERLAVPLAELAAVLHERGIEILAPAGEYTRGLLLQAFTKPERNLTIPPALKAEMAAVSSTLEKQIENGKLLELVSRRELPRALAQRLFSLYGLAFDACHPLHSAPVFHYFLPAQAAHVIKTSVQTGP